MANSLTPRLRTLREEMLTLRARGTYLEARQARMRANIIKRGLNKGPNFRARVEALTVGREVCNSVWPYLTWSERLEVLGHYERKSREGQEMRKMEALG